MKIKLCGVGNQGKFNHFIIQKKQESFELLRMIMKPLEIIPYGLDYDEYTNKKGIPKIRKYKINKMIDKYAKFESKKARVEIFFGKNKIFVSIFTSFKNREKIMDVIQKNTTWVKRKIIPNKRHIK